MSKCASCGEPFLPYMRSIVCDECVDERRAKRELTPLTHSDTDCASPAKGHTPAVAAPPLTAREALTRAAELLQEHAEQMRDPCSAKDSGDFSCEDCPADGGHDECRAEWQERIDAATAILALRAEAEKEKAGLREDDDG